MLIFGPIVVLGVLFTATPYLLITKSMETLKAQEVSAIISLEPVYGIVFAAFIIQEIPDLRTVIGGVIIVGVTIYSTWQAKKT